MAVKNSTPLTQERLRELLYYDAESGVFTWIASGRGIPTGSIAGTITHHGYRMITIDRDMHMEHRLAWLYVHGKWPTNDIDHINNNRMDNRIGNLREASRSENMQNQKSAQKHNKSGFLGVCRVKNKWRATIKMNDKQLHIGYFSSPELAHEAYVFKKREIHLFGTL